MRNIQHCADYRKAQEKQGFKRVQVKVPIDDIGRLKAYAERLCKQHERVSGDEN